MLVFARCESVGHFFLKKVVLLFVCYIKRCIFDLSITKNRTTMKKTVLHKNEKIKVDFTKSNFTRVIESQRNDGVIIQAHGTNDFIINNKTYQVSWTLKRKTMPSIRLHFEGFTCGDSEKKMIEHIIEKYGV